MYIVEYNRAKYGFTSYKEALKTCIFLIHRLEDVCFYKMYLSRTRTKIDMCSSYRECIELIMYKAARGTRPEGYYTAARDVQQGYMNDRFNPYAGTIWEADAALADTVTGTNRARTRPNLDTPF